MNRRIHTTVTALMLVSILAMACSAPAVATSSVEQTENADNNADETTNEPVIVADNQNNNSNSNELENTNTNANDNNASATSNATPDDDANGGRGIPRDGRPGTR